MVQLGRIELICKRNEKSLEAISEQLEGNGRLGLKLRVDRLEQASKRRTRLYSSAVAAVFAVCGALVLWLLKSIPAGP